MKAAAVRSLVALASLMLVGAAPAQQAPTPTDAERKAWEAVTAAVEKNDCATVLQLLKARLAPKAAARTPEPLLAFGYDVGSWCAAHQDDTALARSYAVAGTGLESATDEMWARRLGLELDVKDSAAAAATVAAMSDGHGAALNAIPIRWLYLLDSRLRDAHLDEARLGFLHHLTQSYDPGNPADTVDGFRREEAEMLADRGDTAGAGRLIGLIDDGPTLVQMSFDSRFRTFFPADYDARATVERHLARMRGIMENNPHLLAPILEVSRALRLLGRPQEAVRVLETARAAVLATPSPFTDAADQVNWWWDELGRSHERLGEYDAAVAAFRAGVQKGELGAPNVSQMINLAEGQVRLGHPDDALATLAPFDPKAASPYGELEMRFARGCAAYRAGKADVAAQDLDYVRAHEEEHPEALPDLLMCAEKWDEAAAATIRRLDRPDRRAAALLQLSDFDPPPVPLPHDTTAAGLARLKARPDVQAAIARAGGTRRIHLQASDL